MNAILMPITGRQTIIYLCLIPAKYFLFSPVSISSLSLTVACLFHRYCDRMKPNSGSQSSEPAELPITETPRNGSTTKPSPSNWQAVLNYAKTEISLDHADIPVIACCLVSGLCDSSSYNAWSCFVSMQTGQ